MAADEEQQRPRVSVVIPTWNRADLLDNVLATLAKQTLLPAETLVVDNGSRDNSREVSGRYGAKFIAFEDNRGFAVAVNEGIQQSAGEWILILNNDVMLGPEWLARLVRSAIVANASFAVGKLVQHGEEKMVDGTWDLVSRAAYAWRCGYGRPDAPVWSERRIISSAPMTAALFHRRVFQTVGLLETRLESYYEDVDFGIRCAMAGLTGLYDPSAVATHRGKSTLGKVSDRVMFLTARNQLLLIARHYSPTGLWRNWWPILIGQTLSVIAAAKHGHPWAAVRGKWSALRRWRAFREMRHDESRRTRVPAEVVLAESEAQIYALQKEIGFDPYWRLYFSLVRSGQRPRRP